MIVQMVGFVLSFVNVGRALQRCKGRLFPFGWFHVLRELRRSDLLDINGMGILEKYRGLGGNVVMYNELYRSLGHAQFEHADLTQMADPGKRPDKDYAVSWVRRCGKGRVFYTTLGHACETYWHPLFLKHLLAGVQWAIGDLEDDAPPSAE